MENLASAAGRDSKETKPQGQTGSGDEQQNPKRPVWLLLLLRSKFFVVCPEHRDRPKDETNAFCIDCCSAMCQICFLSGDCACGHRVLQIRRHIYQNVVCVKDIKELVDCSMIKKFSTNRAKVIRLNPKTNSKALVPGEGFGCETCQRRTEESSRFCSIACSFKIALEVRSEGVEIEKPGQIPEPLQQRRPQDPSSSRDKNSCSNCPSWETQEPSSSVLEDESVQSSPALSASGPATPFRKRKRKGTPHRSPMF